MRIEGAFVVPQQASNGGFTEFSLQFYASTSIFKAKPFAISLVFIPKLLINSFLQNPKENQDPCGRFSGRFSDPGRLAA